MSEENRTDRPGEPACSICERPAVYVTPYRRLCARARAGWSCESKNASAST